MLIEAGLSYDSRVVNGGNRGAGPNSLVVGGSDYPPRITAPLRNRYIVVRHGESQANVQEKIVSNPAIGVVEYGLTTKGLEQARRSIILEDGRSLDARTKVYTSPFLRCVETAREVARTIKSPEIALAPELRERFFGAFEGGHKAGYKEVYALDKLIPGHNIYGVESTEEVAERATSLIRRLERKHQSTTVLLVTHADVGEILQAIFLGVAPHLHRDLPKLKNAEARELRFPVIHEQA